ncbi:MAG: hypothetical protein KatS3mg115_0166 [Candidatus Poribacteria bacterium]|nr:MAG: hypothetical protein KatS3mg115_0166 [Candidatus Poribacteria bacterium]
MRWQRRLWAGIAWALAFGALLPLGAQTQEEMQLLEAAKSQLAREYREGEVSLKKLDEILDRMAEKGLLEAAVEFFGERISKNPSEVKASFGLGGAFLRLARSGGEGNAAESAREYLAEAFRAYPSEELARLRLVEAHLLLNEPEEALSLLRSLLDPEEGRPQRSALAFRLAAEAALQQRDLEGALGYLREAIAEDPGDVKTRLELVGLLRRMGRLKEAAEELGQVLRRERRNPEIYYELGKLYAQMNDPDQAIEMYRRAAHYDPNNAQARYDLAHVFLDVGNGRFAILSVRAAMAIEGRYEKYIEPLKEASVFEAESLLSQAADETPDNAELLTFLARLHVQLGNREEAKRRLEQAIAADPTHARARAELARLLLEEEPERAAQELRMAVESNPDVVNDPATLAALAEVYQQEGDVRAYIEVQGRRLELGQASAQELGEYAQALQRAAREARQKEDRDSWRRFLREAEQVYKQAQQLEPNNPEWVFRLATVYDDLGMLKALKLYEEAAQLSPNDARIYYRWGRFLMNFGTAGQGVIKLYGSDDAIPYLEKAVQLDPKLAGAHYALGIAYMRLGDLEKGYQHLAEADRLGFMALEGVVYLAPLYVERGRLEDALRLYRIAFQEDPDNVELLKDFALVALKMRRPELREEAIEALRRVLDTAPDDPEALMNYGYALHSAGRSEEAVPFLEQAAQLEPNNPQVLYNLAIAQEAAGQPTQALETWRRLLEADTAGTYTDTAQARIAYLQEAIR